MSQLGSIFEPEPEAGPRGRDLRAEVTVPGWALGHDDGCAVEVPRELPALGGYARRVASDFDTGDDVQLRLPADFPDGGTLRLRGQGEAVEGGRAGDLLLTIRVEGERRPAPPSTALAWSPGQALVHSPAAPISLVLLVGLVFAAGIALLVLL